MTYLEKAKADGHVRLAGEGKQQKITYIAANKTENYADPEEKVRAEFWAELIYRYEYPVKRIGVEVTIPDRLPTDRADLIVFEDDERKQPYAVIECKKDKITDAEFNQAVEQVIGNGSWAKVRAKYVMVVAGITRRAFDVSGKYKAYERDENIIADVPRAYGKPEEFKFYKGGLLDIERVNKEELIAAIRKCHQTLWGGGKLSPPAAFGELCKIIFVKISDEKKNRKKGEPYQFQIKTNEKNDRLAERIRALYEAEKVKDPEVFTETIKIDAPTISRVVSHLERINLSKTDLDTKGLAFEQFMDGFFKGDFGQYFTPREIITFSVEMMQPGNDEFVLDPACGSGGFLLHALDSVRRKASDYHDEDSPEHRLHWHDFAQKRLFGIEINDEIARVAKMNMILHDDGHTNVIGWDALEPVENIHKHNPGFRENRFDLVLTNPPFGAMVKQEEKPYLSSYDMSKIANTLKASTKSDPKAGKKAIKQKTSVKTEVLFCERVWRFLKPGTGRAAIVLPDGILTTSSLQGVRDWLLSKFQLCAVVSLPQSAFAHFGAGVKSSVVFVRKRAEGEKPDDDEAIFMASAENIGYDATGRKTFKIISDVVVDLSPDYQGRSQLHRCDLYDEKVIFEMEAGEWIERRREVVPDTGIVGQY